MKGDDIWVLGPTYNFESVNMSDDECSKHPMSWAI